MAGGWWWLLDEQPLAEIQWVMLPFPTVKKKSDEAVLLDRPVDLRCAFGSRKCYVKGPGAHFVVEGSTARLALQGFEFRNATEGSVRIAASASSSLGHVIRNCLFRSNTGSAGTGAAVTTEKGTRLRIVSTRFVENRAVGDGSGVIAHDGAELYMTGCTLKDNSVEAAAGGGGGGGSGGSGAVVRLSDRARAEIESTKFVNNRVAQGGADISASFAGRVVFRSRIFGRRTGSDGCSGLLLRKTGRCYKFNKIPFLLGTLVVGSYGLAVSQGLDVELVASSGQLVTFTSPEATRSRSKIPFHLEPDGAAVFALDSGGSRYVSNSEIRTPVGTGGVYGLEFDNEGFTKDYKVLLTNTTRNCNGGVTAWGTWVSCEEFRNGQCWQVDPEGRRPSQMTALGGDDGGLFEAFASDTRNLTRPSFFVTEDAEDGAVRRFRPGDDVEIGWDMISKRGEIDFLEFLPNTNRFRWTASLEDGKRSASSFFPNVEGIAHQDGRLLFVSKKQKELFILDLDNGTYAVESTQTGQLEAGPDQLLISSDGVVYFSEDGGSNPGIFVYDRSSFRTLLETFHSKYNGDETTGIDFSIDGFSLFFCLQENGKLFRARRVDGLPFQSRRVLKWKYDLGRR